MRSLSIPRASTWACDQATWVVQAATRTDIEILALDWAQNPVADQEIDVTLAERVWQRVPGETPADSSSVGVH